MPEITIFLITVLEGNHLYHSQINFRSYSALLGPLHKITLARK